MIINWIIYQCEVYKCCLVWMKTYKPGDRCTFKLENGSFLASVTLGPSLCGRGWGWRWVSGPVWRETRSCPPAGLGSGSNSAKDSVKHLLSLGGRCQGWSVGCCGRGASGCPAPRGPLRFVLAWGGGGGRVLTGCGVWSPAAGFPGS